MKLVFLHCKNQGIISNTEKLIYQICNYIIPEAYRSRATYLMSENVRSFALFFAIIIIVTYA